MREILLKVTDTDGKEITRKVVHAHWINTDDYSLPFECSNCGEQFSDDEANTDGDMLAKYCSECGAKMDEETTDDD